LRSPGVGLAFHRPDGLAAVVAVLALSPDAVLVTDRHNRVVAWNASAEHLLGYTEQEMLGMPCADLEGCDQSGNRYCSDHCPVVQIASHSESVRQFDLSLRARDGHSVLVDVSILTLVPGAPGDFYLAHVLSPVAGRPPRDNARDSPAPRDQLSAVRQSPDARARRLTAREVEVLGMLAAGRTTPEIAERLHISTLTARNHLQNILDKLEVHSKAEAVAFAFQKRLI